MNQDEFNSLPIGEQAIIIWDKARFIQVWEENPTYKIGVYLLFDKITSVYYDRGVNTIVKIKMLGTTVDKQDVLKSLILN